VGYLDQNPIAERRVQPFSGFDEAKEATGAADGGAQYLYLLPQFQTRERVAVALVGWLAPRRSEAFGLQWQDVDTKLRVVQFRRGLVAPSVGRGILPTITMTGVRGEAQCGDGKKHLPVRPTRRSQTGALF
jgi:hypothetical protein